MSLRLCAYQYCNAQTYIDMYSSAQTVEQKIKVAQTEHVVKHKSEREHIQVSSLCLKWKKIQTNYTFIGILANFTLYLQNMLPFKQTAICCRRTLLLHFFDVYGRQRGEMLQLTFCVEHSKADTASSSWKFVKVAFFYPTN